MLSETNVILTIIVAVIFTAMLIAPIPEYTYNEANAKIFIKKSSNNCNGDFCQSETCVNNDCHTSASNSTVVLNSTNP